VYFSWIQAFACLCPTNGQAGMTALGYLITGVVLPALRRFYFQPFPRQFNCLVEFLLQQFEFQQFGYVFSQLP
jgi:hypothetical protein